MIVQASVSKDAEGKDAQQGTTEFEALDAEALKKEVLDACRRLIAESLRDRRER